MTIEEIRKNAPNGATHYRHLKIIERVLYFKKIKGQIFWFDDCNRWSSVADDDGLEYMKKLRGMIKPL